MLMARLRKISGAFWKRSAGILSSPEAFLFAILFTKRLNSQNVATGYEGTGMPIRDCAESYKIFENWRTTIHSIHVSVKVLFERCYLVLGLSPFEPRVNCPRAPTLPPFIQQIFLDFCAIPNGPSIFLSSRFTK